MAVYVVEMTSVGQEIASDDSGIAAYAASMAVYNGEMTGYASEIMNVRIENDLKPIGYGSKPTATPCFVAFSGRSIQDSVGPSLISGTRRS